MSRGSFHVTLPQPGEPMRAIHGISKPTASPPPVMPKPPGLVVSRGMSTPSPNGCHPPPPPERGSQDAQALPSRPASSAGKREPQFILRNEASAVQSKHSNSSAFTLHLQSVQKVAAGATGVSPRGTAHVFHFTLDWRKMCQHRETHSSWAKVKSSMFGYGGQMWCVRGHVNSTVKDPSFLIIYPSCLLDCKEKRKRKKSSDPDQSPTKSSPRKSTANPEKRRRFSSIESGESRYRCCMAYKLSLLCTSDANSGRYASGQSLTVTTDDEGVIFDSGKPLNPLQLVIPVGLLTSSSDCPSQYILGDQLHVRLVCWPVKTAFSCNVSVLDLFPWDGSSQQRRFDHICWESEVFLYSGAWWRIVMFPKGHGQGSAQKMTIFLELLDLASTRKMPAPELPLAVQGVFNVEQHRSTAAMMVSAVRSNIIRNSHEINHKFSIGDLCGCRDSLLLQAEVDCVTLSFEVRSSHLQGAWCQPGQTATTFNGSPEMWAWYMQNHQSRWLRPGSRSLSARSSLNNLSPGVDPHHFNPGRFSQVFPLGPVSPGVHSARSFSGSPGLPDGDEYVNGCVSHDSVESMDNVGRPPREHRSVSELTKEFQQSCSLNDDGEASV